MSRSLPLPLPDKTALSQDAPKQAAVPNTTTVARLRQVALLNTTSRHSELRSILFSSDVNFGQMSSTMYSHDRSAIADLLCEFHEGSFMKLFSRTPGARFSKVPMSD